MSWYGSGEPVARFLLARLVEREQALMEAAKSRSTGPVAELVQGELTFAMRADDPARVFADLFADLIAKQRIVQIGDSRYVDDGSAYDAWLLIVRLLASAYSRHPEYDERWRP